MQGYNCIMVYSPDGRKLLFCKRTKNPYNGLYNLVGGKIEKDENGFAAAYRELREETGIDSRKITLNHMMDFTYYNQNCYVEVYVGQLKEETLLYEEAHPLEWLSIEENFFDSNRFAGEGNIGHMVEQVRIYGARNGTRHLLTRVWYTTASHVSCIKDFYKKIKDQCPETKMAENFKREFDKLNGVSVMGIYGSAHIDLDAMDYITKTVPCMANQLKEVFKIKKEYYEYKNSFNQRKFRKWKIQP